MTGRRGDAIRLADMLRSATRIEEIRTRGYDAFAETWVNQSAVIRELEVLGEAAGLLSPAVRGSHPEVAWAKMRGFGSFAKHEYWRVDPALLWKAVEEMPRLRSELARIASDEA